MSYTRREEAGYYLPLTEHSRTRLRNSTDPDGRELGVESPPGHVSPGISPLHAARLYDML